MSNLTQPTLKQPERGRDFEGSPETRLNVRLSPEARATVDWIAEQRGVSNVEAIRRAIGTEKFFLELAQKKAKVYVEIPGEKHLKEVVFI